MNPKLFMEKIFNTPHPETGYVLDKAKFIAIEETLNLDLTSFYIHGKPILHDAYMYVSVKNELICSEIRPKITPNEEKTPILVQLGVSYTASVKHVENIEKQNNDEKYEPKLTENLYDCKKVWPVLVLKQKIRNTDKKNLKLFRDEKSFLMWVSNIRNILELFVESQLPVLYAIKSRLPLRLMDDSIENMASKEELEAYSQICTDIEEVEKPGKKVLDDNFSLAAKILGAGALIGLASPALGIAAGCFAFNGLLNVGSVIGVTNGTLSLLGYSASYIKLSAGFSGLTACYGIKFSGKNIFYGLQQINKYCNPAQYSLFELKSTLDSMIINIKTKFSYTGMHNEALQEIFNGDDWRSKLNEYYKYEEAHPNMKEFKLKRDPGIYPYGADSYGVQYR